MENDEIFPENVRAGMNKVMTSEERQNWLRKHFPGLGDKMKPDPFYISTDNDIRLTSALASIDEEIKQLEEKRNKLKALKPKIAKILQKHDQASWGKGLYNQRYDKEDGTNEAFEKLQHETNQLKTELEALGFTINSLTSWDCIELL